MIRREQIGRGRLRAKIVVQSTAKEETCILCPTQVSERLHKHFAGKRISSLPPKQAIFGVYSIVIVMLSRDQALAEISEFVGSLPNVCYEQDGD